MSPPATVHVERRGDAVVATMDTPQRHNAADLTVYHLLEDALALDASCYVLTGAGGDFSAGDDVAMFAFDGETGAEAFLVDVTRLFQAIEALPRPVVAAVDGYALGFGFELALVCDAAVATPDAVLGLPEIRHGAAPPNAMGRGPDILGRGLVRHLALRGTRWLSGREAQAYGMVAELHPPASLVEAAVDLALDMAAGADFALLKRLVNQDAEATYRLVPSVMTPLMASPAVATSQRGFARG